MDSVLSLYRMTIGIGQSGPQGRGLGSNMVVGKEDKIMLCTTSVVAPA